jgi:hypothetical protein
MKDNEYYNFSNQRHSNSDVQSLVHLINFQGKNLIGLELGVFKAQSFCTLLQNCPNVKELHGIDSWQPYIDYLKTPYDGTPAYSIDKKTIDFIKLVAYHNIEFSGQKEKAFIHEKDSNKASTDFKNNFFDFMFIDTYMTYEQAVNDLKLWYPKLKKGGLFTGHDWNGTAVSQAVIEFRKKNKIKSHLSLFDNCWAWKK